MSLTYIGLGSNLGQPLAQVRAAINELQQIDGLKLVAVSPLYASSPMGPQDQPDYINAVAAVDTSLPPHDLLTKLQLLEQQHGRQRLRHWGERTLDLDILLYGQQILDDADLTLPHPGLTERNFVVYPLADIAPDIEIPGQGPISQLITRVPRGDLTQVETVRL